MKDNLIRFPVERTRRAREAEFSPQALWHAALSANFAAWAAIYGAWTFW